MSQPLCFELEAGTHYLCTCGKSSNMPYCDGAHKGSDFAPHQLDLSENKTVYLCSCSKSKTNPFCDGSHSAA